MLAKNKFRNLSQNSNKQKVQQLQRNKEKVVSRNKMKIINKWRIIKNKDQLITNPIQYQKKVNNQCK